MKGGLSFIRVYFLPSSTIQALQTASHLSQHADLRSIVEEIEVGIYFAKGISQLLSLKPFRRALPPDRHDLLKPVPFLFISMAHLGCLYHSSMSC